MPNAAFSPHGYQLSLLLARSRPKNRSWQNGSSGNSVKQLQQRLSQLGYNISVDGSYGPQTAAIVKEFQQDHGAKVDGVVGKDTLGKLQRSRGKPRVAVSAASTDIASVGAPLIGGGGARSRSQAAAVPASALPASHIRFNKPAAGPKLLPGQKVDPATGQKYMTQPGQQASAGHPIGTTDVGKAAENVKTQQIANANNPAAQDGVPEDSNPAFNSLHPRDHGKFAAKGTTGTQAVGVQQHLNQAGVPTKVDGNFGPKTERAVKTFQKQSGLQPDGIVGPKTVAALVSSGHVRVRNGTQKVGADV